MKYKLYLKLERKGNELIINDTITNFFSLDDYIFKHDLEPYSIVEFKLEKIEEQS